MMARTTGDPEQYLDTGSGELKRGRVMPADRQHLRAWLARFAGQDDVHFALEGCTGWRYVAEELLAAGIAPHLAEPADTAALRGRKRHAKTDKTDTRHLRVHLMAGDLPECWIPPGHVLEARAVARLYKDLLDERGAWHQRIAATLFHQGVPVIGSMATAEGRAAVEQVDLSPAGRQAVQTGLRQIDRLTGELDVLRRQLGMLARRQPGCRALRDARFGIGPVTAVAIWAELGDVRRFANSVLRQLWVFVTSYPDLLAAIAGFGLLVRRRIIQQHGRGEAGADSGGGGCGARGWVVASASRCVRRLAAAHCFRGGRRAGDQRLADRWAQRRRGAGEYYCAVRRGGAGGRGVLDGHR